MDTLHYRITIGYQVIKLPVTDETTAAVQKHVVGAPVYSSYNDVPSHERVKVELVRPLEVIPIPGHLPDEEKAEAAE
jgi:hypothetical protein